MSKGSKGSRVRTTVMEEQSIVNSDSEVVEIEDLMDEKQKLCGVLERSGICWSVR
jgi:hypothetical protein